MRSFCLSIVAAALLLAFCQVVGDGPIHDSYKGGCCVSAAERAGNAAEESGSSEWEDDDALIEWKPIGFPKTDTYSLMSHAPWPNGQFLRAVILPPPQDCFLA